MNEIECKGTSEFGDSYNIGIVYNDDNGYYRIEHSNEHETYVRINLTEAELRDLVRMIKAILNE